MSLPIGLSTVSVACGPYTDASGAPYKGVVTFTPSTSVTWTATGALILNGPVSAVLDSTGAATVVLPATDATGLTATGFTYAVSYFLTDTRGSKDSTRVGFSLQLPKAVPTVVLETLVPVAATGGVVVAVPTVQSVAGLTGVVTSSALNAALGGGGSGSATLLDRGNWATSSVYAVGDVVTQAGQRYACRTAHTAGTFAADLTAAKWVVLEAVAAAADATVVHVTGAETVAGVKTFTSSPVVPTGAFPESAVANLTTDLAGKLTAASNLSDVTNAATARTNLGLGTAATQASSAFDAAGAATAAQAASLQKTSNLSDLGNAATARTNLGLGSAATISTTAGGDLTGTLPSPTVAKVNGVAVTGVPSAGQALIASGASAATWGTVSVGGEVVGSGATYAALPTVDVQGAALKNGDIAYLTADTVGTGTSAAPQYPRGAYTWNGAAWALALSMGADLQFGATAGTIAQGNDTRITGALQAANNLSDLASAGTARGNLGAAQGLTRTAVKTGAYTAVAGDLVPCDTTSGAFTVTLPTAPADKSRVAVKHVIRGGTNIVTIACGGSDVFNVTGGVTTAPLTLSSQGVTLEYNAAGGIWTGASGDLPLSQLDLRYDAAGAASAVQAVALPKWQASTAYTAGQLVVNPSGQVVSANATFTSAASYTASSWTLVPAGASTVAVSAVNATGTPSSTTYLRGDGSWSTPAGGGGVSKAYVVGVALALG